MNKKETKKIVREAHGKIAEGQKGCCGPSNGGTDTQEFAKSIGYSEEELKVIPAEAQISSLSSKIKELIAIGTSVGVHCESCLEHHVHKARAEGVSEDEIQEAISTGQQVERGAIEKMQRLMTQLTQGASHTPAASLSGQERNVVPVDSDDSEASEKQSASCCTPLDGGEQNPKANAKPSSCCGSLDAPQERSGSKSDNAPQPVYSGWVTAETKYGMYLPALEQDTLRDAAGNIKDPLPGPEGVTDMVKEARIGTGSKVLEVAASVGHIAMLAAKVIGHTGEATLAQLDPTMVEAAKAYIAKYGLNNSVKVVQASAKLIPYPTNHFDAVISDRAVCCLYSKSENQQQLMNEIVRVTNHGGRVVLIEAIPTGTPVPEGKRIPSCILNTTFTKEPEKVVAMLRMAGLEGISIKRVPITRMATQAMCETAGVQYSDEYMEFAIISARKNGAGK